MVLPVDVAGGEAAIVKRDVAAVVVTYNSARRLGACLTSLRSAAEIVVVDNASSDGVEDVVARVAPAARFIANDANRGFAAAVNQGVRAATAPIILLLNPDARLVEPEASLDALGETLADPAVGAAGGRLEDRGGAFQRGFGVRAFPTAATLVAETLLWNRLWPGNPLNRRYRMADFNGDRPLDCDQPAGALLAFRREVFERVGGFDENFHPLWFEDVDFCLRVKNTGLRVRFDPRARAEHEGGHSIESISGRARREAWYGNLLRFADKHLSARGARAARASVAVGLTLRALGCAAGFGGRGEAADCLRALRAIRRSDRKRKGVERAAGREINDAPAAFTDGNF